MSLKQTARIISTYASDTSGVCSALYELGGITIMHDASGCNSTYNTHDEPRWYDTDSLVFISALTEKDAIMGADEKLINDAVSAAQELHPRFVAIAGTPIPMMTGADYDAIARGISAETGLPAFGFATDGMHSYVSGAGRAFAAFANDPDICPDVFDGEKNTGFSVNILGVTPLDFSVNGQHKSMVEVLENEGIGVNSVWAMGCSFEEISASAKAHVNLVVSGCGIEAAKVMEKRFGIPYVVGTPYGSLAKKLCLALKQAAQTGKSINLCAVSDPHSDVVIIGEGVTSASFAAALFESTGKGAKVICATDLPGELCSCGIVNAIDEDDIIPHLSGAKAIVADPLYKPICPPTARFVPLAHEGFSGRIYRDRIPNLIKDFETFRKENDL